MNRPASIVLFEKLYIAVIVIGVIGVALSWNSLSAMAETQPGVPGSVGSGILIGALIFGFLVPLLLLYFIARRASNIAKWIFVILTAFSVYSFIATLSNPMVPKGLLLAVNVLSLILTLYCAWLLFKPDAKAWLESKGADGPADPTTFE
jgi:uncharacterized membrane protein